MTMRIAGRFAVITVVSPMVAAHDQPKKTGRKTQKPKPVQLGIRGIRDGFARM
jgi:hypothetical protein